MGERIYETEKGEVGHGVLAEFESVAGVYHAAERVRDAGYTRWDVHSPFPIHGIEDAMGIRRTRLPLIVAVVGFTGAFLGWLMQYWMNAVDYELVVQGKPYGAWEPFVPIIFEVGVLSAVATALSARFSVAAGAALAPGVFVVGHLMVFLEQAVRTATAGTRAAAEVVLTLLPFLEIFNINRHLSHTMLTPFGEGAGAEAWADTWAYVGLSAAYAAAYAAAALAVGALVFRRRSLS
jgi:hypothetical protein